MRTRAHEPSTIFRMLTEPPTVYDSTKYDPRVLARMKLMISRRATIGVLVRRDLSVRYKKSILGVWWTLLNPLMTALILWLVFSAIFDRDLIGGVPYIVYMLSGVLFMGLFGQGLNSTANAIQGARPILIKVPVPPEVFSFSAGIAAAVNFLASLIPLVAIMLFTGVGLKATSILALVPVILLMFLAVGLGLIVSVGAVQFHDLIDFVRVITTLTIWTVPTFYPIDIIPASYLPFFKANPLFAYIDSFRQLLYLGSIPQFSHWATMILTSFIVLGLGIRIFARAWRSLAVML